MLHPRPQPRVHVSGAPRVRPHTAMCRHPHPGHSELAVCRHSLQAPSSQGRTQRPMVPCHVWARQVSLHPGIPQDQESRWH